MSEIIERTLVCDRCGWKAQVPESKAKERSPDMGFFAAELKPIAGGKIPVYGDICPRCVTEFNVWWKK